MKTLSFLFTLMFLVFLGACTTGGSEPATEPPTESLEPDPVLDSVSPGGLVQPPAASPESYPGAAPILEPLDEAYPGSGEDAADSEAVTSQAHPAQVDLSQLTPQPVEEAYPVVAPRPGVPDPVTAVAHQVSQDLAQRLNLDISEIITINTEEREWPDSSLGCPSPDLIYLAVITPGYQIILEASGVSYDYHTDTQGNYILCGDDGSPITE